MVVDECKGFILCEENGRLHSLGGSGGRKE